MQFKRVIQLKLKRIMKMLKKKQELRLKKIKVNIEKKLKTHTVLKNIEFKKSLSLDK